MENLESQLNKIPHKNPDGSIICTTGIYATWTHSASSKLMTSYEKASALGDPNHESSPPECFKMFHVICYSESDRKTRHGGPRPEVQYPPRRYWRRNDRQAGARACFRRREVQRARPTEGCARPVVEAQGRLTGHRINLMRYKLGMVMKGDLDEVIAALKAARAAELLAELEAQG